MKRKDKLPKQLFIYRNFDRDVPDHYWYMASDTVEEAASLEEDRFVGVYQLKEIGKVSAKVVYSSKFKSARKGNDHGNKHS
jgi:hypothetical protein